MITRLPVRLLRANTLRTIQNARPSTALVESQTIRSSSTSSRYPSLSPNPSKKGIKIGYVFSALALLGISATSYGLYQFYSTFTIYPDSSTHPIRSKLRAAIRAESSSEYSRADTFFQQAYELCLDLYKSSGELNSKEGLINLSGIAVRWGGMWEKKNELERALEVYDIGFQPIAYQIQSTNQGSRGENSVDIVKRGAGLALKLGDLWTLLGSMNPVAVGEAQSEAERYYTWAVEELMRLSLTEDQKEKVREQMDNQEKGIQSNPPSSDATGKDNKDGMDLPSWVGQVELVAAFERLGDLYSRQGKIELAQPLLQQAITTLYPPPKKDSKPIPPPPISQRCHAATLMNNLSSSLVTAPSPSSQSIEASSRWARQALSVSNSCKREADKSRNSKKVVPLREREEVECELTAVVACYNLGKLAEMSKDTISAEQWFVRSEKLATELGLRDAVLQARESLRRLKHPTIH
ncbi:hypothetical protein JCM3765_002290 [Sporobolomyces pararoseus]